VKRTLSALHLISPTLTEPDATGSGPGQDWRVYPCAKWVAARTRRSKLNRVPVQGLGLVFFVSRWFNPEFQVGAFTSPILFAACLYHFDP
jgi:hypothetical protein